MISCADNRRSNSQSCGAVAEAGVQNTRLLRRAPRGSTRNFQSFPFPGRLTYAPRGTKKRSGHARIAIAPRRPAAFALSTRNDPCRKARALAVLQLLAEQPGDCTVEELSGFPSSDTSRPRRAKKRDHPWHSVGQTEVVEAVRAFFALVLWEQIR